jgi:tetratricopeptide (TPR) repeat protein
MRSKTVIIFFGMGGILVTALCADVTTSVPPTPGSSVPAGVSKPAVVSPLDGAKKLLAARRSKEAAKELESFLSSHNGDPEVAEARYLLGTIQQGERRNDEALRTYNWVISHHQGSEWAAKAYVQSAQIQEDLRNPAQAQLLRETLLREYPASATTQKVWVGAADNLFEQQKFAQAAAIYQKFAAKLDAAAKTRFQLASTVATAGGNTSVLLPVANQILEENKPKIAQRFYKIILDANPPQAVKDEARVRLGWCLYLQQGKENYAQAQQLWQQVSQDASASEQWKSEADWHLVQLSSGPQGDWKKAVQLCDQISQKRASGSFAQEQALYVKAWLLTVHEQWREAVAAYAVLQKAFPEKSAHLPFKRYVEIARGGLAKAEGATSATTTP